ncbi:MAG: hypothetical protein IH933_16145 [Euryarchaeota archaeon]|nr:hypothetical protein [Euryarchaeota archaeon]
MTFNDYYISCESCGYSELYRGQSKNNVVDFFLG